MCSEMCEIYATHTMLKVYIQYNLSVANKLVIYSYLLLLLFQNVLYRDATVWDYRDDILHCWSPYVCILP